MIPCELKPVFKSALAEDFMGFFLYKRSCGYKYESEGRILMHLDKYFVSNNVTELTAEIMAGWTNRSETESGKTHSLRNCVARQLALYLSRRGTEMPLPLKAKRTETQRSFTPYIFTKEQITLIFKTADTMAETSGSMHRRLILPIVLRFLYCCGLRISEGFISAAIGDAVKCVKADYALNTFSDLISILLFD